MSYDKDDPRHLDRKPCYRYPVYALGLSETGGVWISTGERSTFADDTLAYKLVDLDGKRGFPNRVFTLYVQPTPEPPDTCKAEIEETAVPDDVPLLHSPAADTVSDTSRCEE